MAMVEGKYFLIESLKNNLVMEVKGEGRQSVVASPRRDARHRDSQLWYEDGLNGLIVNKRYGTCMDIVGDDQDVMATPVEANRAEQQWLTTGNRIQDRQNSERVVTLITSSEGDNVVARTSNGDISQAWKFSYEPAQFFYIQSQLSGKVMNVMPSDGATELPRVFMWNKKADDDNQLWYEDKYGTLHSKLRNLVLDSSEKTIQMNVFESGKMEQLWVIAGNKIVKQPNPRKVIGIKNGEKSDGAKLVRASYNGAESQHWTFEPADVTD